MEEVKSQLVDKFSPFGLECHEFQVGWYNKTVQPEFRWTSYDDNSLAFVIISTPEMFDKAFVPFVQRHDCLTQRDPLDDCMIDCLNSVRQHVNDRQMFVIHDFELEASRKPRVLVQTAGHVAGAAFYYQRKDVNPDPWPTDQKIYGVSIHPKYGGWFAFRGVVIFPDVLIPDLEEREPIDCVPSTEDRKRLLEMFNFHWQDWKYRDIVMPVSRYSDLQKTYFQTLPRNRKDLIEQIKQGGS